MPAPAAPPAPSPSARPPTAPEAERRTSPVELLWDLVFVFAVTQVTTLLAGRPTWGRWGEAMLVLALMWWAWSAFVWAVNAEPEGSPAVRASLLTGLCLVFIAGLAVPRAFGDEALLFAVGYTLVRVLHLALYVAASRRGRASASAIAGFAATVGIGMALLILGAAAFHGLARALVWLLAAAIDYAGPAWLTRDRLRGIQQVAVAHFSERYGLFVIICLGESILAVGTGVGTAARPLTAGLVLASALSLLVAIGMWWTYFDRFAARAEAHLRAHADPVLAAADAYSYIHLVIVAGIIVFAAGVRLAVHLAPSSPIADRGRLALCGGVALYLAGLAGFRARIAGDRSAVRPVAAAAALSVFLVSGSWPAWTCLLALALVMLGLCAAERRWEG